MPKLVLFDIDGTLIDSGGAGTRSLDKAFYEVFSVRDAFSGINMAGKTDIQIIKEGLAIHRITLDNGVVPAVLSSYVKHLELEMDNDRKHVKPGVAEILSKLSVMEGCLLGLLTGNIEKGARIKLGAFKLNGYFPLGAFGSDDEDRDRLLPIAVKKLSDMINSTLSYGDCVVVGDTPLDVACSKPYGALSVAVSTGPYSYESLLETGADIVVKDLRNAEEFLCTPGVD